MGIMLRMRTLPAGFIAPCLPTKTDKLPSGSQWLHEIKHDGLRIIARKDGERVRLYSRPGNDFTRRFPLIVDALSRLRSRSCIIDGEAVACDENGVASFDLFCHHGANESIFLYAFDLIELNGDDPRRDPLEVRKATLRSMLAKAGLGLRFNEHMEGDGPTVFAHACKLGLEGMSRSGRLPTYAGRTTQDELEALTKVSLTPNPSAAFLSLGLWSQGGPIMKKLSMLGIIGGAALLTAAPFPLQWSQKNVALSLDSADARIARRPLTPLSIAGAHRRAYRRASAFYGSALAGAAYGY